MDAPRWLSIWESTEEGTSYYFRPKRAALIWGFVGSEFSRSQAWIISSCEVAWELPSEVSTGMHSRAKERELPKFFEAEGSVFYDPGKEGHSECGEWCWEGGSGRVGGRVWGVRSRFADAFCQFSGFAWSQHQLHSDQDFFLSFFKSFLKIEE